MIYMFDGDEYVCIDESSTISIPRTKAALIATRKANRTGLTKTTVKNEKFYIYIRTKDEMIPGMASHGTHSCSVKFGDDKTSAHMHSMMMINPDFTLVDSKANMTSADLEPVQNCKTRRQR